MSSYRSPFFVELRDLILGIADPQERLACSVRAEQILDQVVDGGSYEAAALAKHIRAAADTSTDTTRLDADDARHDLRQLITDIAAATIIPVAEVSERVSTIDEVAKRWNVSGKTIRRWRDRGLLAHTFLVEGRQRVGFLESSLQRFAAANAQLIRRGSRFSRINDTERSDTLQRAERLFGEGMPFAKVVSAVAGETGRSEDSIRQLLRQSGKMKQAGENGLSERAERRLFTEYCRGKPLAALAQQHGISRSQVRQIVNRMRLARIFDLPLDYMPSPEFSRRGAERRILAPTPATPANARLPRKPRDLPAYIASLYDVPLLTTAQEQHLFRKYNYLKYLASQRRDALDVERPSSAALKEIERLYQEAIATKNLLVRSNLRLVVAVAKKQVDATSELFEKISEGNVSLMRAVEKFDYTRGFKFSTYATWAIKKNFIRAFTTESKRQDRFRTGHAELLDARPAYRADAHRQLAEQQQRERQVRAIMQDLTERERQIIASRFGLGAGREPMTLKDVGRELGVSKERVRQIEARAMAKLRQAASTAKLELPGVAEPPGYEEN